jgi:hypothetical protein
MKGRKEERKQVKLISIHGERQWLGEEERLSGTVRELNNRTDTDAQKRARLLMMMTEKDVAIECKEGKPQKHLVIMNNERARSGGWFEAHQSGRPPRVRLRNQTGEFTFDLVLFRYRLHD